MRFWLCLMLGESFAYLLNQWRGASLQGNNILDILAFGQSGQFFRLRCVGTQWPFDEDVFLGSQSWHRELMVHRDLFLLVNTRNVRKEPRI